MRSLGSPARQRFARGRTPRADASVIPLYSGVWVWTGFRMVVFMEKNNQSLKKLSGDDARVARCYATLVDVAAPEKVAIFDITSRIVALVWETKYADLPARDQRRVSTITRMFSQAGVIHKGQGEGGKYYASVKDESRFSDFLSFLAENPGYGQVEKLMTDKEEKMLEFTLQGIEQRQAVVFRGDNLPTPNVWRWIANLGEPAEVIVRYQDPALRGSNKAKIWKG